jgi:hypothetical protein
MEWGIVLAFPTVLGMLFLVFAAAGESDYQTFDQTIVNPPAIAGAEVEADELKMAA